MSKKIIQDKKERGRPTSDKYNVETLIKKIGEYVDTMNKSGDLPILKEFTFNNGLDYEYLLKKARDNEDLLQSIRRLLSLKELRLERGALSGKYNHTFAIFSLKQMGWRDNPKSDDFSDVMKPLQDYFKQLKADAKKDNNEDD